MSKTKYPIDSNSKAWDEGYRDFMDGRHYYIPRREEYQRFKNYNAGYNKAKEDTEKLGKDKAFEDWRVRKLKSAIGKTEQEARDILRLADGNILRHEIDAVMIELHSTSEAFNTGRDAYLNGKNSKQNPFYMYADKVQWATGFQATELAVRLHGRQKVIETL